VGKVLSLVPVGARFVDIFSWANISEKDFPFPVGTKGEESVDSHPERVK
jgi:hypothetical protein